MLHVDSQGAGPPLVLLHGWAMHSGVWGPLADRLAGRFRVYAIDLPGHGNSVGPARWTLEDVVAMVRESTAHEPRALTVIGWSLGGMVALRWAELDRERIARIALICTSPRLVAARDWPHAMAAETLARFGDELRASYRLTMIRFLTLQLSGTEHGRVALAILRRRFFERGDPSSPALCEALAMLSTIDLRDHVGNVTQPTLVIAGVRDTLVPLEAGEWLASALPSARLAPIPGAAHAPFLSHPIAFDAPLDRFLAS